MNATQQLVEKIINYGSASLIVVSFAVAIIYLSVYFISGAGDKTSMERKETIKRVGWTFLCLVGVVITPTFVLIFKDGIIAHFG